jgi:peptide chain release factor 3
VELFLESFLGYAVQPGSHKSDVGEVEPEYPHFTGFVFKVRTLVFNLKTL